MPRPIAFAGRRGPRNDSPGRASVASVVANTRVRNRGLEKRSILTRKRFQFAGAVLLAAFVPYLVRSLGPATLTGAAATNALLANIVAIAVAFWMRLSVETYPGTRRSAVILPSSLTGHGITLAWFILTRLPYDRPALLAGFIVHVIWLYLLYIAAERRTQTRIAVVPLGEVERLNSIPGVEWVRLSRPDLKATRGCEAIVADFSADLSDEWEAFLADAALAGRIVYQHKQLSESLTGRVDLERLSENSFGSLVPSRAYFHLKGLMDFLFALLWLPIVFPVMVAIAVAIRLEGAGPVLFSQQRVGHGGRKITVYKFRTMHPVEAAEERSAAITVADDDRVTRVGRILRKLRIDELPQMFNILKWEMSWIGPRPEAEVLSLWYTAEIPFYRYRHVVKPGITGWAQVNQGHVAEVHEVHEKLRYDFYYIKYFSPWLDLLIFLRTIKTMLTGFGSK